MQCFDIHLLQVDTTVDSRQLPVSTSSNLCCKIDNQLSKSDTQPSSDEICGKTSEKISQRRSTLSSKMSTIASSREPTDELKQKLLRRLNKQRDPDALEDCESQIKK